VYFVLLVDFVCLVGFVHLVDLVPALNQSGHSELFNLAGQYYQTRPLILTKQGQPFL